MSAAPAARAVYRKQPYKATVQAQKKRKYLYYNITKTHFCQYRTTGKLFRVGFFGAVRELVNGFGHIFFTGFEEALREIGLIGCVGIILRFKAEAAAFFHGNALFACRTVEEVSGIELHTGQSCINIHFYAAFGAENTRTLAKFTHRAVHAVVMIVAAGKGKLLVFLVNTLTDEVRCAEIKGCSFDKIVSAVRNTHLVNGRVAFGKDLNLVVKNSPVTVPFKVKISVVC